MTRRSCQKAQPSAQGILPRIIRLRDAPGYLGMDRNRFNAEVRPCLTEIPIGCRGIGFDRLELDQWTDEYVARNGRPGRKGEEPWDAKWEVTRHVKHGAESQRVSLDEAASGTSKNRSGAGPFAEALARINLKKPK